MGEKISGKYKGNKMTPILKDSIEKLSSAKTESEIATILANYALAACMDSEIRAECMAICTEE